jgi:hypothetical protein
MGSFMSAQSFAQNLTTQTPDANPSVPSAKQRAGFLWSCSTPQGFALEGETLESFCAQTTDILP